MTFWMKCSTFIPSNRRQTFNVGTYVKAHSYDRNSQGQHYYHFFSPNIYPDRWLKMEMNAAPSFRVGSSVLPALDPEWVNTTTGAPVHYFDGMTRFYIDMAGVDGITNFSCSVAAFELMTETGEPDTDIRSVTATYNGDAYEVSWNAKLNSNQEYEVRYSTSSMKAATLESGKKSGGKLKTDGGPYGGLVWKSPKMPEDANGMYFAITVVGATQFNEIYLPAKVTLGSCLNGDLDGDGFFDAVDLQKTTNAALVASAAGEQDKGAWSQVESTRAALLTGNCQSSGTE
jgi:hypothetical protein